MKSDLDRLMRERNLAALVIPISHAFNPELYYLVGRVHVSSGLALKKQGEAPIILANPMEVEEAAHSGLTVYSLDTLGQAEIAKQFAGDPVKSGLELWRRALAKIGVTGGRIGIYGAGAIHHWIEFTRLLNETHPQYEFIGESGSATLFTQAVITKDADELTRMRSIAERTNRVLQQTWDFITQHRLTGEQVIKADQTPLTIGEVRQFIRRALLEVELEDTGLIFAQGRDGGIPHSRGQDDMGLLAGQAIVFDLFPRELGGGYHHDVTRTWCISYAPDEIQRAYDTVMSAFDVAVEAFNINRPAHQIQEAVQDYLEKLGHPTQRSTPGTTDGYVHSLGHGVGLNIHEAPRITHLSKEDTFAPGNVITIEPGLYYPDKGYGIRVEDTFYVAEDGSLVSLSPFRKDLILPLK